MADQGTSSVIIAARGEALGILTERDALRLTGCTDDPRQTRLDRLMSQPVLTVTAPTPAYEAIALMWDRAVRRLVVVDDTDRILGMLTQRDVLITAMGPGDQFTLDLVAGDASAPRELHCQVCTITDALGGVAGCLLTIQDRRLPRHHRDLKSV